MSDPVLLMAVSTDQFGEVDAEPVTVQANDQAVRLVLVDGSDLVFDRQELFAALSVEAGRRAA